MTRPMKKRSSRSNYSSKNLLAKQSTISTLNQKALTPRIADKMGIHMDLITGHGNSEYGSKLIEIVKARKFNGLAYRL